MAKRSTKPVGEVVAVPRWPGKFMVRVIRYPSGRKLPEPRILLCAGGAPFNTAMQALDALRTWQADPKSAVALKVTDAAPRAPKVRKPRAKAAPVVVLTRRTVVAAPVEAKREVTSRAPLHATLPVPAKELRGVSIIHAHSPSPDADLIARHIAAKGVTKGAEYDRPVFRSKHGGAAPAYLDPVKMGTRESAPLLPCTAIKP